MSSACIICHKKKVKCDLSVILPCTNCKKADLECRPYTRKRKRFTNSLSPTRDTPPAQGLNSGRLPAPNVVQGMASDTGIVTVSLPQANVTLFPGESTQSHDDLHQQPDNEKSYLGRSEYLGGSVPFDEALVKPSPATSRSPQDGADADLQMLWQQRAFDLPPKPTQDRIIQYFMQFCAPWNPIVDWDMSDESTAPSELLLQAVFLAGSRVCSGYVDNAASEVFYRRAKLLFFFGGGNRPLSSITAACLLHWYNPVGPENVSTDTSSFWIRVAGAMAFQIGLHKEPSQQKKDRGFRRRLWWTLVARDNVISAGVGRPRTINLRDSDVLPPSLDDFLVKDDKARVFLAYVTICQLLGNTAEYSLRRELSPKHRTELESALFRWNKQTIHGLQSYISKLEKPPTTHTSEMRQLLVVYFVVLNILNRSPAPNSVPTAMSLMASSFLAGIYEQFFKQDELEHLGPAFTFYGLCAGLTLLSAYRYPVLQEIAEYELTIIKLCLQQLSKRWHSAIGPLQVLDKLTDEIHRQPKFDTEPQVLDPEMAGFFEDFDTRLCKQWPILMSQDAQSNEQTSHQERMTASILASWGSEEHDRHPDLPHDQQPQGSQPPPGQFHHPALDFSALGDHDLLNGNWEGLGFDWSGSWLLNI
ncbi:hypothetical protein FQN53_009411 [Emmonsiellopsis sp. PD_33]|nr:hypothetical protein FQN53_009411 [Emmonsiellopsis sp. PD_33]KAK2791659.1 hypothetical protein FQN51_002161 [Onygenales sp. PD_10]